MVLQIIPQGCDCSRHPFHRPSIAPHCNDCKLLGAYLAPYPYPYRDASVATQQEATTASPLQGRICTFAGPEMAFLGWFSPKGYLVRSQVCECQEL